MEREQDVEWPTVARPGLTTSAESTAQPSNAETAGVCVPAPVPPYHFLPHLLVCPLCRQ